MTRDEIHKQDARREREGVPYVGMPSDEPCDICGKKDLNQTEPRFYYTVCRDHARLTPIEVSRFRSQPS